jgi:hypothetical protein
VSARAVVPRLVRAGVLVRAAGLCEACGGVLPVRGVHLHHRVRRRDGGDTLDNLVALHPLCHVLGPSAVHERPGWARGRGLVVAVGADPAVVPLVLPSGRVVLLDAGSPRYLAGPVVV